MSHYLISSWECSYTRHNVLHNKERTLVYSWSLITHSFSSQQYLLSLFRTFEALVPSSWGLSIPLADRHLEEDGAGGARRDDREVDPQRKEIGMGGFLTHGAPGCSLSGCVSVTPVWVTSLPNITTSIWFSLIGHVPMWHLNNCDVGFLCVISVANNYINTLISINSYSARISTGSKIYT